MTDKSFTYSGPAQSLEIRVHGEAEGETILKPVDLVPGRTVELPEDHPVIVSMIAAEILAPAPAEAAAPRRAGSKE